MRGYLGKMWTIKQKWLAFSLFLSITPLVIFGFASSLVSSKSLQEEVDRNYQIILKQIQIQIDHYVNRLDQISLTLADNPTLQKVVNVGIPLDRFDESLQAMDTIQKAVLNSDIPFDVSLLFTSYEITYSHKAGVMRQIQFPNSEFVRIMQSPNNSSLKIPPNTYSNQKDLLIVRSVPLNTVSPKGILVLQLDTNRLQEILSQLGGNESRTLYLFDDAGRIVTAGKDSARGARLPEAVAALQPHMKQSSSLPETLRIADEMYALSSVKSSVNGWTYVALSPMKDIKAKADKIKELTMLFVLGIGLLWGLAAAIGSRRMLLPLQNLLDKFSARTNKAPDPDLIQAFDRFFEQIQVTNEQLQSRLNEQVPLMKEYLLLLLIRGELPHSFGETETRALLEPLKGDWFYVGVVEIDQLIAFKMAHKDQDRSLFVYALRKMIEETIEQRTPVLTFSPRLGQVVFLVAFESAAEETEQVTRLLGDDLRGNISRHFPFTISVMIGACRRGYPGILAAYEEALSYLECRWSMGTNVLITPKEFQPQFDTNHRQLVLVERTVIQCINRGEFEAASLHLGELLQKASQSLSSSDIVLGLLAHFMGELDNLLQESGNDLQEALQEDVMKRLYETTSLDELGKWMMNRLMPQVRTSMETHQIPRRKQAVQQVVAAIHTQFDRDLSLQQLAEIVHVAPPTLSKWFKVETGENFGEFLIRFRMEKAKEWLLHTDKPIREIAERLQYTSVQNFTRIFKQTTGLPPGHFRDLHKE